MKTFIRDDTKHGIEYVEKSDAIEAAFAAMGNTQAITLTILPGSPGVAPMVRHDGASVLSDSDAALVARVMLKSAAYLFTQGQAVQFGREVPHEALR